MKNASSNSPSLTLRPMQPADVEKVLRIEEKCFPDPWPRTAFEDIIKHREHGALVAIHEKNLIAYVCYLIIAHEAHLTNLAVTPEFRRKSAATQLLDTVLQTAQRKECEYVLLEVRPRNESAIAFYEKAGFRLLYRRPKYYRNPVEDALVMVYYFSEGEG